MLVFVFDTRNVSKAPQSVEFGPFYEARCPVLVSVLVDVDGRWVMSGDGLSTGVGWTPEVCLRPGETDSRVIGVYHSGSGLEALKGPSRFIGRKETSSSDIPITESGVLECPPILGDSGEIVIAALQQVRVEEERQGTSPHRPSEGGPASEERAPDGQD
ncbi:MAG: hypothetical protein ACYS9X_13735 [Planctomycetota bacterium]